MKQRIKVGDQVEVISGESKGRRGEVLKILHGEKDMRVTILGVNVRKKCMRKCADHPDGAILEREMPVHYSNVRKIEGAAKGE
ncbi:MAG: 50S ribosomal protein L24 [Puniceicoccales bacterium]|jgi:large subunit ribosomal protein L24|nr:50S ribosomal protein L24 [Puniceicoccales bacterium]